MRTMVRTGSSHMGTTRARTSRRAQKSSVIALRRSPAAKRRVRSTWVARSASPRRNQVSPPSCASAAMKVQVSPAASPAGLRIGDARERVRDGIQIRRDAEAEMLEVIAGVAHHHQAIRRQQPVETERELGAADAAGQRDHAHCRRSSEEIQLRVAQEGRRRQRGAIPREPAHEHRGPALVGLPHQQLRRRGDLVGEADLGDHECDALRGRACRADRAAPAAQRRQARARRCRSAKRARRCRSPPPRSPLRSAPARRRAAPRCSHPGLAAAAARARPLQHPARWSDRPRHSR